MKQPRKTKNIHEKRRYGHHQKRSRVFSNTYLPYLPMTIILFLSVLLSGYSPRHATLAYATSVDRSSLLNSTNAERRNNSQADLKLNEKLNEAAQAKANDMTSRNYWSHNTPDGEEPWVFINSTGYAYLKAGENLAYGFGTSAETIQGWMNSPSHRDNLLDKDYTEVGFGFANSSDYNSAGQETVVVAMYGKPSVLATQQQTQPTTIPAELTTNSSPQTQKVLVSNAKPVTQIERLSRGGLPWLLAAVSFVTGLCVAVLLLRHGLAFKRLLKNSQQFITHHPLIDSTLIALVILGLTLTRTIGFIQ